MLLSSLHSRSQGCALRGGQEPEELPQICGKGKKVTREQKWRASGRAGFRWICTLYLHIGITFKVIQHSLLFSHAVGITALHYARRCDVRIGEKAGYRKFHPRYTWNGGKKPNWSCQKVFKELYQKKKKPTFSLKSKQRGK